MTEKLATYFFNNTNKYVREHSVKGEDSAVSKLRALFAHNPQLMGCQTGNTARLLEVYLGVPAGTFKVAEGRSHLPAGIFARTTHQRPRLVLSIGNGEFIDSGTGTQLRAYRPGQYTLDFVHKDEVVAFCKKHSDIIDRRVPVVIL